MAAASGTVAHGLKRRRVDTAKHVALPLHHNRARTASPSVTAARSRSPIARLLSAASPFPAFAAATFKFASTRPKQRRLLSPSPSPSPYPPHSPRCSPPRPYPASSLLFPAARFSPSPLSSNQPEPQSPRHWTALLAESPPPDLPLQPPYAAVLPPPAAAPVPAAPFHMPAPDPPAREWTLAQIIERCTTWAEFQYHRPAGSGQLVDTWERMAVAVRRLHSKQRKRQSKQHRQCMEDVYAHVHAYTWEHLQSQCPTQLMRVSPSRHNAVVDALYRAVLLTGGQAKREASGMQADSLLRPDMRIVYPGQHVLTDIAVTHSLGYRGRLSAGSQLSAAKKVQREKRDKYAAIAARHDAEFLPFVAETCGGLAPDAVELLDVISSAAAEHLSLWSRQDAAKELLDSVSIAIQKGNAMTVLGAHAAATLHAA